GVFLTFASIGQRVFSQTEPKSHRDFGVFPTFAGIAHRVLLDTCALLWLVSAQKRLSPAAKQAIQRNAGELFVSSISAFEVAVKASKGKLDLPIAAEDWFSLALEHHGIREVPVDSAIALASVALPPLHNDPCDRFIVATSTAKSMPVITCDPLLGRYPGVSVVW
ncbi:MAG: hypothetical protein CO096_34095, partial [Armatimonadetes bacterium CG_4_9_14_3_um_filter_66_14]